MAITLYSQLLFFLSGKGIEYQKKKNAKSPVWVSPAPHPWPPGEACVCVAVSRMRIWGGGGMRLLDDGAEKWIAAPLSFKCTYSPGPSCVIGSSWGMQPCLTWGGSHWGRPAVFQGFSDFSHEHTQLQNVCGVSCPDVSLHCDKQIFNVWEKSGEVKWGKWVQVWYILCEWNPSCWAWSGCFSFKWHFTIGPGDKGEINITVTIRNFSQ